MKQKLLLLLLGSLLSLPMMARDFEFTYEGQTLTYTVIDEEAKTCKTKEGNKANYIPGNNVIGSLIIPEKVNDGNSDYTVTSISDYAFYNCYDLTSVDIPNSVASIGKYAFYECRGLTSVLIPNSVTSIGECSFQRCSSLTSVTIPNSVTSIEYGTFSYCKVLASVTIPNSVTSIGNYAFEGCCSLTSVTIPESVTSIGKCVFDGCSSLTSVTIPNSITEITDYSFHDCSSLTSVTIPGSVTSIGSCAFSGCTGLTSVTIPDSVTSIGEWAFSVCSSLTSFTIPPAVTSIGMLTFAGCSSLTSFTIPASVTYIGERAFEDCSALASMMIGPSVTSIGRDAFSGCSNMVKSAYPNTVENPFESGIAVAYDPEGAFIEDGWIWRDEKSEILFAPYALEGEYVVPASVTSIGNSAFVGCNELTSVKTLSETPAYMPVNAFEGLYETVGLTVPDACVNKYLASSWGLFNDIQTSAGNKLPYFSDGNLEYRLNTVDRTATVTGAKDCSTLSIPASFMNDSDPANAGRYNVKSIGVEAFKGRKVSSVVFDSGSCIEVIGDYAFADTDLGSVNIPSSVAVIGNYAFYNTPDLYRIELNEGLVSIGRSAFAAPDTRYGKAIVIPTTVNAIDADAFYNFECSKVETPDLAAWCSIDFGNEYANPIYNLGALYVNAEKLNDLILPTGLEEVKPYAFYNCFTLRNVIFPQGLKRIGSWSFYGCNSIAELTIPSSVVEIGNKVFASTKATFSDGLSSIDIAPDAFYFGLYNLYWGRLLDGQMCNVQYLNTLEIGGMITDIPDGRFKDCIWLNSLTLGSAVKTIGAEAFSGCPYLQEVVLPPSVEAIGASAFAGASNLESIIMGQNVKFIGERAFSGTIGSMVSITAQTPPEAPNNAFSNYNGCLYLQGQKALNAYRNAFTCWDRFDSYEMVEATSIRINKMTGSDLSGNEGDTFQLTATVYPLNVTLPQVFWSSTNPDVATVDQNGLVTLHADNVEASSRARVLASCRIIAETLYADGPVAEVTLTGEISGVEEIVIDGNEAADIDYTRPYDVYNMNGLKVGETTEGLSNGIYIIRQGNAAVKTLVR